MKKASGGGGRKKKSAKVSVSVSGKKKLPPVAQMLSDLRASEIDVEKKLAKERELLQKLENMLATENPLVAAKLKEIRSIVPKGIGAKAGIEAINKFIGALEVSATSTLTHTPLHPSPTHAHAYNLISARLMPSSHARARLHTHSAHTLRTPTLTDVGRVQEGFFGFGGGQGRDGYAQGGIRLCQGQGGGESWRAAQLPGSV